MGGKQCAGGDGNDVVLTRVEETPPVITSFGIVPGTGPNAGLREHTIAGTGISGLAYRLEKSTGLAAWSTVFTATAAPDGSWSFLALEPQTSARTFYRVTGP